MTCFTRKTRSYFRFAPPPYPRDKTVSDNSPPPGPKGWTCPGGCPGGMVTGKIEPCISATKNLPLSASGKLTTHSVRKTCIKTLLDSGVSHNNVAQLSGHKSLKSLDSYAVASHQQQRQMSKILSGKENSRPKPKAETAEEKP